jgi:hypothetical protein
MDTGWIKIHRKLLDNPTVMKDADHFAIWVWLLLKATHEGIDVIFGGERITLSPGQFTTGRKVISNALGVSESKVQRVLSCFESEHQIEQRTDRQCRLITVLKWSEYQKREQRNEHQMNNDRTTSEQRVNTKQECKNERMKETESEATTSLAPIKTKKTPSQIAHTFFEDGADHTQTIEYLVGKGVPEEVAKQEMAKFISYWTEPNKSGTKVRWQGETHFDLKRRMVTWFSRIRGYSENKESKGIKL